MIVLFKEGQRKLLTKMAQATPGAAEPGPLNGVTVDLFKANVVPDPDTDPADLTLADFSGYAQKTVTLWGASFENETGNGQIVAPMLTWNHNGGAVANDVYGYYVKDADDVVLWAERFDGPKAMNGAEDAIMIVPSFELQSTEPVV